jgi:hypothetical protein
MHWTGINYWAVPLAAVAAWLAGAVWYGVLFSKAWTAANGYTPEQMAANKQKPGAFLPFIYCFLAELMMAFVLSGIMMHAGPISVKNGLISGALCWVGFVMTQQLRDAQPAPFIDRWRSLAGGAAGDGRDHWGDGEVTPPPGRLRRPPSPAKAWEG